MTPTDIGESACRRCGGPNTSWHAPSPLWNAVMRGGAIDGPWEFSEIICAGCFMTLAEERGIATGWIVDARTVHVPLETVTPSGRVWDAGQGLWVPPPADMGETVRKAKASAIALRIRHGDHKPSVSELYDASDALLALIAVLEQGNLQGNLAGSNPAREQRQDG